jgi:hypothetical protein
VLPRPLVIGLTVLIAVMWAANLIVGYLYPDRSDPAVNAIFALVAGAVYGLQRRARRLAEDRKVDDRGDER